MKVLLILALCCGVGYCHAETGETRDFVTGIIEAAIDTLRPKLKDLHFPCINIDQMLGGSSIKLKLKDLRIRELEKFEFSIRSATDPSRRLSHVTNMTIYFNEFSADGFYWIDTKLDKPAPLHLWGEGPLTLNITGLRVFLDMTVEYKIIPPSADLTDILGFNIELEKSKIELENLFGGGGAGLVINNMLSNMLPRLVEMLEKELINYKQQIIDIINGLLPIRDRSFDTISQIIPFADPELCEDFGRK